MYELRYIYLFDNYFGNRFLLLDKGAGSVIVNYPDILCRSYGHANYTNCLISRQNDM